MSPEQWRGQPQDAATDQYSLAVLSYELISGSLPFVASDITSLMSRVMSEPIALIQGVSNHVNVALVRALAKDPRERFASCKEFADALEGKEVRKKVSLLTKFAVGVAAVSAGVLLPLKKK
jgi:serine/threonine-protein kinase